MIFRRCEILKERFVLTMCLLYTYYVLTMSSFDQDMVITLLSHSEYMLSVGGVIARVR